MHHNPLRDIPAEDIHKRLGTLGVTNKEATPDLWAEVLSYLGKASSSVLNYFSSPLLKAPKTYPPVFDPRS